VTRNHCPSPKGLTLVVALLSMIGPFTIDTYLPAFPAIEAEFNVSRALLSQSMALYLAAFAISTLVGGPLADRFGRRRTILGALLIYLLASLGCALANDYGSFLFFRLLQGIAAGGALVAGRTMVRDVYNPQDAQRVMSRVMMLFMLAPAVAPVFGGWLHDLFGWRSIFYFLTLFSGLVFVLMMRWIPETLNPAHRQSFHPRNVARIYGNTLTHRRFLLLAFIVACYFGGGFIYIVGAPSVVFDFLGLSSNDFAVLFVPMVAGIMAGAWISGRVAHRWPVVRTARLALLCMLLAALLNTMQALWLKQMVLTAVLPLVLYNVGFGIAMPAFMVLSLDCFPNHRGSASGMQGFVQTLSIALLASLAVPLLLIHPAYMAMGQLLLVLVALGLWWCIPPLANKPSTP